MRGGTALEKDWGCVFADRHQYLEKNTLHPHPPPPPTPEVRVIVVVAWSKTDRPLFYFLENGPLVDLTANDQEQNKLPTNQSWMSVLMQILKLNLSTIVVYYTGENALSLQIF